MKAICLTTLSIILILSFGVMTSQADVVAIAFDGVIGDPVYKNGFSLGWQFNVNQPITVTYLGLFDYGILMKDPDTYGLLESETYHVGIFGSAGNLLVDGWVLYDSPDTNGFFRYVSTTPTLLNSGEDYRIAAFTQSAYYTWDPTNFTWNPEITFVKERSTVADGLVYPQDPDEFGPINGYFGPNFQYEAAPIPEPASIILLGSGLIGLAGYGRKKLFKK